MKQMEQNMVKKSQLVGGEPVSCFTSVVEDLNSGLPWTNPASGQGGTWTRGLRIASPALQPLDHAAFPFRVPWSSFKYP